MKKNLVSVWLLLACTCYTLDGFAQYGHTKYGLNALSYNQSEESKQNTAYGYYSLFYNTYGSFNTANGSSTLYNNKTGTDNTAIGANSLHSNTASFNTATGSYTLYSTTSGWSNTANGYRSLYYNTTGNSNTASGHGTLYTNTIGEANTASGRYSLYSNTSGSYNTASGYNSLYSNTTGIRNTAIGFQSLYSNVAGSNNTALGMFANVSTDNLTNATVIGYNAVVDASNKVRIGNTSVTSIGGQVGWTTFSDGRYKEDIKENVPGLAFINSLRPVTYTVNVKGINASYNREVKPVGDNIMVNTEKNAANAETQKSDDAAARIVHNGFVAQEVETAAKHLDFEFSGVDKPHSKDGLYGLRYDNFIAPLVKAVQELSKLNDEKDAKISRLQTQSNDLENQINELKILVQTLPKQAGSVRLNSSGYIKQNFPNPSNNTTVISYYTPDETRNAQISVADIKGSVLRVYNISKGEGQITIKSGEFSNGTYNYTLYVNNTKIDTKQMVLFK